MLANMVLDPTTILVLAIVCLLLYLFLGRFNTAGLPPRPVTSFPVVGHLLRLERDPCQQFRKWRKQHGDIFSLYMGSTLAVILNGYDTIKEALVKQAGDFTDRPFIFFDLASGFLGKGVVFNSGPSWKEQRDVSLSILRHFGMGKNLLAVKIQEEVSYYVAQLRSKTGKPYNIHMFTNVSIANITCSILTGERFEYNDEKFRDLIRMLNEILASIEGTNPLHFFPFLRFIPGDLFHAKRLQNNMKNTINLFAKNFLAKKGYDEFDENNIDNFIGAYIQHKRRQQKDGKFTFLDDDNLVKIILEIFAGGTETSTTTIMWCVLYMLHYPAVQEKIFKEIEAEVGLERPPSVHDRIKLTYLNAVIMESQRLGNVLPLSMLHKCSKDLMFKGFRIPKGTNIIPNLDSVMSDPKVWGEDVDAFRPERFLDQDGNVACPEQFIPFSIGRRICLGESLAKMELFLYLATMFQQFQFLPCDPSNLPPLTSRLGVVRFPLEFQVRMIPRSA